MGSMMRMVTQGELLSPLEESSTTDPPSTRSIPTSQLRARLARIEAAIRSAPPVCTLPWCHPESKLGANQFAPA